MISLGAKRKKEGGWKLTNEQVAEVKEKLSINIPFEVDATEHGSRADVFLSRRIKRMSRSVAAEIIRIGNFKREGGLPVRKPSERVRTGDRLFLRRKPLVEKPTDDIQLPVVYEDEHLLAVNKPGDLVVHPTASAFHRTLIRVLRNRRPGEYLTLAHRLDKETSGVMLLCKTEASDVAIKDDFAFRRVKKAYHAIVVGVVEQDEFVVDAPLRLAPDSLTSCLMETGGEGAAPAVTDVSVIARGRQATLVEARPRTGRQHQIRVHLAHVGHPIIGDKLYLGDEELMMRALGEDLDRDTVTGLVGHWRQALHAERLILRHPILGQETVICAPTPADLLALAVRHGITVGPDSGAEAPIADISASNNRFPKV